MISFSSRVVRALIRLYTYPYRKKHESLSRSVNFRNEPYVPPEGCKYEIISADGIKTEVLAPQKAKGALIHFHGGGHTAPMNSFYRKIAQKYATMCNVAVYSIDYQAGKELVYPSVHDQTFKAYLYLAKKLKNVPFVAAGDSFGANLMLSACLKAAEGSLTLPQALVAVSPFADMAASGQSYERNCRKDPIYSLPRSQSFREHEKDIRRISPYCAGAPLKDKYVSAAYADLRGFPDMLIIYGSYETSASDGEMIYENAVAGGVNAKLRAYSGMWHDFLYLFPRLPESKEAWREIRDFIQSKVF